MRKIEGEYRSDWHHVKTADFDEDICASCGDDLAPSHDEENPFCDECRAWTEQDDFSELYDEFTSKD